MMKQSEDNQSEDQHERMEEMERERLVNQFNRSVKAEQPSNPHTDNNIGEPDSEFIDNY